MKNLSTQNKRKQQFILILKMLKEKWTLLYRADWGVTVDFLERRGLGPMKAVIGQKLAS